MKSQIIVALTVALFGLGGVVSASAQNAPTTQVSPSPSSVNKGSRATNPSGAENKTAATNERQRVAGHGKYCRPAAGGSDLNCFYASMRSCEKHSKSDNLRCVTNPNRG